MTERASESTMLYTLTKLRAADSYAGVVAERYRSDPSHPVRVAANREANEWADRMVKLIEATDTILEHEVAYRPAFCRPGDPSRVKVEDTPASGAVERVGGLRASVSTPDNTLTVDPSHGQFGPNA